MRRGWTLAPDPHDRLFRFVFGRPAAIAIVLRRVLPAELLACLDMRSLRRVPTTTINARLRARAPDLCFKVHAIDGSRRVLVYIVIEHQSSRESHMPWRALMCAGELWDRHIRVHPSRRRGLPFIVPVLFTQHPARNTPVQLSKILDLPARLHGAFGTPIEVMLHVGDFSGSILDDRKAPPATRALVELARALLHAHRNPSAITKKRITELARQVDVLLNHKRPGDVEALWVYVISVFETGSPLRTMLVKAMSQPAKELYMTIAEDLLARGQKIGEKIGERRGEARGEAKGRAQSVLGVLEHRGVELSAAVRRRILACRDEIQLQHWFDRAFTVATAKELFEPARSKGERRTGSTRPRTPRSRAGLRLVDA